MRRRHKDKVERIKKAPFRYKINKKSQIIDMKLKGYFEKIEIIQELERKIGIIKTIENIIEVEKELSKNLYRQKMIKKIMPEILAKCSLIKYAGKIKMLKIMRRRI